MTTIMAIRLASLVTAINVLVASGFSIAAIVRPQYLVPAEFVRTQASLLLAMYAAAPRIPLALLVLRAIYKQATPALLILGALAGAMQLLDAGIGLFQHDLRKCPGPLFHRRPPILRGVSASHIRADHAVNQARINARYDPALSSSPQLSGEADAAHHSAVISHARASGACSGGCSDQ
jgi:hypothetical protein